MSALDDILNATDERVIAEQVTIPHDKVRQDYEIESITAASTEEVLNRLGDYYAYHFGATIGRGAKLNRAEAVGRARQLLEGELRRTGKTLLNAIADAKDGQNSGMAGLIDLIANALREESVDNYIENVLSLVDEADFAARESVMRDFQSRYGHLLPSAMANQPAARYASEWKQLLRSWLEARQRMASGFRRV